MHTRARAPFTHCALTLPREERPKGLQRARGFGAGHKVLGLDFGARARVESELEMREPIEPWPSLAELFR